jgi:hypothetical protein
VSNLVQVVNRLSDFRILVTLDEIESQIKTKEIFNHIIEVEAILVLLGLKSNIVNGNDARVTDQKQNDHIKDSLPFAIMWNDDSFLPSLFLFFAFNCLVIGMQVLDRFGSSLITN